eukprot:EG_transcript_18160
MVEEKATYSRNFRARGERNARRSGARRSKKSLSWKEAEYHKEPESWTPEPYTPEPPIPRNSVSKSTLQQLSALIPCRHAMKGCNALSTKNELSQHLESCPFERCKDQLKNAQIDPILRYFKKQIEERDKVIQELQLQCSQNFKEEEERFGLEEEQVALFKDLVFKTTNAAKIASLFGDKYPTAEWSVFIHHVSESDLSYVYDGFLQWVYRGRRYILVKLNKPEEDGSLL